MRKAFISIFLLLGLIACSSQPKVSVVGKLTLENPSHLNFAQISVQKGAQKILDLKLASPNFKLQLEPNTIYTVIASAPEHEAFETLLWTKESNSDIELFVAKETHQIAFSPYIIGSFNGFNPQQALKMEAISETSWQAEVPTENGEVRYQLMGVTPDQRPVVGTQQDTFDYFTESVYTSVIYSNEPSVRIVFTPNTTITDFKSHLMSSDSSIQKEADAFTFLARNRKAITAAYINQYMSESETLDINWETLAVPLKEAIQKTANETERSILLSAYFDLLLSGYSETLDSSLEDAIYHLGSRNPIWSLNQYSIYAALDKMSSSDKKITFVKEVSSNHPDTLIREAATYYGFTYAEERLDTTARRYFFNALLNDFPRSQFVEYAKYQFDPTHKVVSGAQVPAFSVTSLDGKKTYSDESLKGKYVLLDFWATWCGPCIQEMDDLHKTFEQFKKSNFVLLSLSFDEKKEDIAVFRKDSYAMPWEHTFIDGAFDSQIAKDFEITGIPKPLLLDPSGKIIATGVQLRGQNLSKTLSKYLAL